MLADEEQSPRRRHRDKREALMVFEKWGGYWEMDAAERDCTESKEYGGVQ